jgi:hypothetical protein
MVDHCCFGFKGNVGSMEQSTDKLLTIEGFFSQSPFFHFFVCVYICVLGGGGGGGGVLSVKNIIYFRFSQLFIKKGFFFFFFVLRIYNRYSIHGIYLKMVVQVQLFFI